MSARVASVEVKNVVQEVKAEKLDRVDAVAATHEDLYDLISELHAETPVLKTKAVGFKTDLLTKIETIAAARATDTAAQRKLVSENFARLKLDLDMPPVAPPSAPPAAPPVTPAPTPVPGSAPSPAPGAPPSSSSYPGKNIVENVKDFVVKNPVATAAIVGGAVVLGWLMTTPSKSVQRAKQVAITAGILGAGVLGYLGFKEIMKYREEMEAMKRKTEEEIRKLKEKGNEMAEKVRYEFAERTFDGLKADLVSIAKNTNAFAREREIAAKLKPLNKAFEKLSPDNQKKFLKEKGLVGAAVAVEGTPFEIQLKASSTTELEVKDTAEALLKEPTGNTAMNLPILHPTLLASTKATAGAVTDLLQDPGVQNLAVSDVLTLANKPTEADAFADPLMATYTGNEQAQRALWFIAKAMKEQIETFKFFEGRKEAGAAFDPLSKKVSDLLAVGGQGIRVAGRMRAAVKSKPDTPDGRKEAFKEAFDASSLTVDAKSPSVQKAIASLDPKLAGKEVEFVSFCVSKSASPLTTVSVPATLAADEKTTYEAGIAGLRAAINDDFKLALMLYADTPEQKTALDAAFKELSVIDALQLHLAAAEIAANNDTGMFLGDPAQDQALGRLQIRCKIAELISRKSPAAGAAYYASVISSL